MRHVAQTPETMVDACHIGHDHIKTKNHSLRIKKKLDFFRKIGQNHALSKYVQFMKSVTTAALFLLLTLNALGLTIRNESPSCGISYRIETNLTVESNDCSQLAAEGTVDINMPEPVKIEIKPEYLSKNPNMCVHIALVGKKLEQCKQSDQDQIFAVKGTDHCLITLDKDNTIIQSDGCDTDQNKTKAPPQ